MLFKFLRRYFRRRMGPIPKDTAEETKIFLSRLYAFLSINTAGLIVFYTFKKKLEFTTIDKENEGLPEVRKWMKVLNTEDRLYYYKIEGVNVTAKAEYDPIEEEKS